MLKYAVMIRVAKYFQKKQQTMIVPKLLPEQAYLTTRQNHKALIRTRLLKF